MHYGNTTRISFNLVFYSTLVALIISLKIWLWSFSIGFIDSIELVNGVTMSEILRRSVFPAGAIKVISQVQRGFSKVILCQRLVVGSNPTTIYFLSVKNEPKILGSS